MSALKLRGMHVLAKRESGFNLIELIIFILVLGIATTGLFAALNQHNLSSVDPIYQVRALELAQATLDEIIGKRYDENSPNGGLPPCGSGELNPPVCSTVLGPDAGEAGNPELFDDVDDYHGHSEEPTDYAGFTLDIRVNLVNLNGQPTKLIEVEVIPPPPVDRPVDLAAYKANF